MPPRKYYIFKDIHSRLAGTPVRRGRKDPPMLTEKNAPEAADLLRSKKLFVFDMDGTIYLGGNPFDFAVRFINRLRENGRRVLFFTNNASHDPVFYIDKLTRLGFSPRREEICTSGDVTALSEYTMRLDFTARTDYEIECNDTPSRYSELVIHLSIVSFISSRLSSVISIPIRGRIVNVHGFLPVHLSIQYAS